MITFGQARQAVAKAWPDYGIAPYGFEADADWLVLLLPETAGGRIAAVSKAAGRIRWINENADEYTQQRPVGEDSLTAALWTFEAPGQARDEHGRWTDGGGEDLGGAEPELTASTTAAGYPMASFTDHDGIYGSPGGRIVSVATTTDRPDWAHGGPDEGAVFTAGEAHHLAGEMDSMTTIGARAPTPTGPHAFDDGPALLSTAISGGYRFSAFHDGQGDLVADGHRFVQVREASVTDWQDSLGSAGRVLDVDLNEVPDFTGALRAMAG